MKKLTIVLFLLLVMKIQSFACEMNDFKPSLIQQIEKFSNSSCKSAFENKDKKSMLIECENQKNYNISYDDKTIYFLTSTTSKYPYISQCWIDGQISENSCAVEFASEKCQSWNMKE